MNNTREKILDGLLEAFNETGYSSLSIRQMAHKLGISHGNLRYHFPKKEDVLMTLLNRMIAEIDELRKLPADTDNILAHMLKGIERRFEIQYRYRFLFLEQVVLGREVPEYNTYLKNLLKQRTRLMASQMEELTAFGLLTEAAGLELANHMFLFSMNWLISMQYADIPEDQSPCPYFARMCFDLMKTYLTPSGLKYYEQIQS